MKFPSMSQITGGDLSGREGRENARAVELENQYLKNQVKALQKIVEEEKEKVKKEIELRETMS